MKHRTKHKGLPQGGGGGGGRVPCGGVGRDGLEIFPLFPTLFTMSLVFIFFEHLK